MSPELTFAYALSLADADVVLAEREGAAEAETQAALLSPLATGSHVAVLEMAHIGVRNEDDLLRHEDVVWLEPTSDLEAGAESSARRHLDAFLVRLRQAGATHSLLEDESLSHAQVRVDPPIEDRMRQRLAPAPRDLRILVSVALRDLRKERGPSQARLANLAGLRVQNVAGLEGRRGPLNLTHLGFAAAGLGLTVSAITRHVEQMADGATDRTLA